MNCIKHAFCYGCLQPSGQHALWNLKEDKKTLLLEKMQLLGILLS